MLFLFSAADVIRISSYPPCLECKDSFVWAFTRDGNYTVKTGNWLISQPIWRGLVISPKEQKGIALKAHVWSLKTLPKIKIFLWRAISGALAVAVCLNKHG